MQFDQLRRREFITLLGGAAARGRSRRARSRPSGCGASACSCPGRGRSGRAGPHRGVPSRGCSNWAGPTAATCGSTLAGQRAMPRARKYAAELVALAPDVILATGVQRGAVATGDPHRADRVRPGRRSGRRRLRREPGAAGRQRHRFILSNTASSGKWLELLKQIAPGVTRAAVLRDPADPAGIGQFAAIQAVAPSLGVEVSPINVRDPAEIERAVAAFARSPNGGLIVTASGPAIVHRDLIITLAARHKLPAVYWNRIFRHRRRPDLLRA